MKNKKININEYNIYSDSSFIKKNFKKNILWQKVKSFILIILFLGVEALTFIFKNNISGFHFNIVPSLYLIVSAIILALALIFSIDLGSLKNRAFKHIVGNNLVVFILSLALVARTTYMFFFTENLSKNNDLFIGIFILYLIFNSFNKILINKRILKNFRFVSSKNKKYVAETLTKPDIPESILNQAETKDMVIATKTETKDILNFIKNSYESEPFKKLFYTLSIIISFIAVALSATSFLFYKSPIQTLTVLCTTLLIGYPVFLAFSLNLSLNSTCKKAIKKGILITNQNTIKQFSAVNTAILDASLLYPSSNVILKEIKTFHGQRIDEAILYAATLVSTKDGTLNKVFDRIIMGQKKILKKVSDVVYEDKLGICGWVNGKKIIIGNREMLKKHKIDPPSRDYERKYTCENDGLIYIAIDKDLVAMFILEYKPNQKLKSKLFKAIKTGTEILIRTSDPNITQERIALEFDVPYNLIKIIPHNENTELKTYKEINSELEASLALMGDSELLLHAITLCKKTNVNFKLLKIIQIVTFIISTAIGVVLSICNPFSQISELELLTYVSFWSLTSIICSKIK